MIANPSGRLAVCVVQIRRKRTRQRASKPQKHTENY